MKSRFFFFFFFCVITGFSQSIPVLLSKMNKKSVPYMYVSDFHKTSKIVILDAREPKEYRVSKIENAINVGYDKFSIKEFKKLNIDKNDTVVVYCSVGVRSEIIAEKLLKLGYKNVKNLYGGIFEWKNKNKKTVNAKNIKTDSIHTFNKEWSVYLDKGIKVYEK